MSASSTTPKRERLEARVTAEQKALFQHAADLEGRSLTDFIVGSLQASAEEAIARHERIVLSPEASRAFVDALLKPPAPAPALEQAARRYRSFREAQAS
jgi:uncharacterized protein (DUF1778 family)